MSAVILFGTAGLCAITLGLFLRSLDRPKRPRSAMFGGDVTDTVIIDCETDADVLIAGNAKNVTMENVRHGGLGGITGAEAIAAIEESRRSGILRRPLCASWGMHLRRHPIRRSAPRGLPTAAARSWPYPQ